MTLENTRIDPALRELAEEIGSAIVEQLRTHVGNGDHPVAPEYLSPKQVFQLTGISVKRLEALRSVRLGPPFHKVGRSVRYKIEDVHAYIEKGRVK